MNSKANPLSQYPAFDSLHWFQSVSDHHAEERGRVEERAKGPTAYDVHKSLLSRNLHLISADL